MEDNEFNEENKSLDSLTDQEKDKLNKSLGEDLGPEELSQKEQEELEEMALEGDSSKKVQEKAKKERKEPERSFPKKAEEEKKPFQTKSGRHPAIGDRKTKKWRPKPIKVSDQRFSDDSEQTKSGLATDSGSIFKYLGLAGATILAILIILFGLAYVDAKGYLNTGVNQICVSLGSEGGCLPFIEDSTNPVDELVEVRQAFQATSSHSFEAEFNISLSGNSLDSVESDDKVNLPAITGTAKGRVTSEGIDMDIALDSSEDDSDLYLSLAEELISLTSRNGEIVLRSTGFGFKDGSVGLAEDDFISSLEFLSLTSGGITNITKDSQGELSKYEIILDGSGIDHNDLGQVRNLNLIAYVENSSKLLQELDIKGSFSAGELSIKKRYLDYNTIETLTDEIVAEEQTSVMEIIRLVSNMRKTPAQRDAIRKQDLAQIQNALEAYYRDNDRYPQIDELDQISKESSLAADALIPDYISEMPKDPLFDRYFYGYQLEDEEGYELSAVIENPDDPEAVEIVEGFYLYKLSSTE
jgi:hypothetical protein